MITTVFKKSTPINYGLVAILLILFFFLYQYLEHFELKNNFGLVKKGTVLGLVLASLLVLNFVTKRNGLSKDSAYTVFFYFLFTISFPTVFNEIDLVFANFFVILALRRLISLQTLKLPKEKIFDASLWIFVAALFHFWCILLIVLVFISILFHVSRDYRNWVLPFLAFFCVLVFLFAYALLFDFNALSSIQSKIIIDYKMNYFTSMYQNLSFSIYTTIALYFLISLLITLPNRPLILNSSYKKLIAWFFISVLIFAISTNKSNALLIFTFAPLAQMATSHVEFTKNYWQKELVLAIVAAFGLFGFFGQL